MIQVLLVVALLVLILLALYAGRGLARRRRAGAARIEEIEVGPPSEAVEEIAEIEAGPPVEEIEAPEEIAERPRLRDRLGRTRAALAGYVRDLRGRDRIDDETWEEIEEALVLADVGVGTTGQLLDAVRARAREEAAGDSARVVELLSEEVATLVGRGDRALRLTPGEANVWLFVGVNGVGKTTTIGKLAAREAGEGRRVLLAAADTFRAAAAEQLTLWAERVGAQIVRGEEGADPGSVVFDAMAAAASRDADLVLVDTAGRLHTKVNLMEELEKLRRIVDRTEGACKEVLLVIDASTGQNGLVQARRFAEAVDVTGIVLTKLDGTAKGGIVIAIVAELGIPVKFVGIGEAVEDLVPFDPDEFAAALFE